jgi:NDP-sugar pyrophosphorylase family protein
MSKTKIKTAVLLFGGKGERMQSDPSFQLYPHKSFYPKKLIPYEPPFLDILRVLKELNIETFYILVTDEEVEKRLEGYFNQIKVKKELKNVTVYFKLNKGGGIATDLLRVENEIKEPFFICCSDIIFEEKEENSLIEKFKKFVEKSEKLLESNNNVALIALAVPFNNCIGSNSTLSNKTLLKINEENKKVEMHKKGSTIFPLLIRDIKDVNFDWITGFMIATPKLFSEIKETMKKFSLPFLDITSPQLLDLLIERGELFAIETNLIYFNINTPEDRDLYYRFANSRGLLIESNRKISLRDN